MKTPPAISQAEVEALLQELVNFCQVAGAPHCYQNWSPETLRDYIEHHCLHGSFRYVRTHGPVAPGPVAGTMVAWQTTVAHIRRADARGEHVFDWTPPDPKGDCVFFADTVAIVDGALENLLATLVREHPHWARLPWFTYRHKKLVQWTPAHVVKLLHRRRKIYHVEC